MPTQAELDTQVDRVFSEWEKTAGGHAAPLVLIEDAPSEAEAALAQESTDPDFAHLLSQLAEMAEIADQTTGLTGGEVLALTTGPAAAGSPPHPAGVLHDPPRKPPDPARLRRLPRWLIPVSGLLALGLGVLGILREDVLRQPVSPAVPVIDLAQDETAALPLPAPETPVQAPPSPPAARVPGTVPKKEVSSETPVKPSPAPPETLENGLAAVPLPPPSVLPHPASPSPEEAAAQLEPAAQQAVHQEGDETTVTQIPETLPATLRPPELIPATRSQPVYPPLAMRTRAEGRVVLRVLILKDGTVGEASVLEGPAPDMGFRKAAIAAIRTWHYRPAMRAATPVDMPITVVVDFRLN